MYIMVRWNHFPFDYKYNTFKQLVIQMICNAIKRNAYTLTPVEYTHSTLEMVCERGYLCYDPIHVVNPNILYSGGSPLQKMFALGTSVFLTSELSFCADLSSRFTLSCSPLPFLPHHHIILPLLFPFPIRFLYYFTMCKHLLYIPT